MGNDDFPRKFAFSSEKLRASEEVRIPLSPPDWRDGAVAQYCVSSQLLPQPTDITASMAEEFSSRSPELPRAACYDPHGQEEISNRVGSDGIAQPVFTDNQPLEGHTAQKPLHPLVMLQTK